MFQLDHPEVVEVIRNNILLPQCWKSTTGTEEGDVEGPQTTDSSFHDNKIAVVSIFGANQLNLSGHKRAFRLAVDCFGNPTLFTNKGTQIVLDPDQTYYHPTAENVEKDPLNGSNVEEESPTSNSSSKDDLPDVQKLFDRNVSSLFKLENPITANGDGDKTENPGKNVDSDTTLSMISTVDGFYCATESILFLHLSGAYDPQQLQIAAEELRSAVHKTGFISVWSTIKSEFCRNLLLMFSLSHILILSDTGTCLDTSYLHLFRVLDAVRTDIKPAISRMLESIEGLHKDWIYHGRLCSPRLLLLFEVETESKEQQKTAATLHKGVVKHRQSQLEDEIYHIFRKCRIITNVSANSLFAIPSEEEYVFLFDKSTQNSSYEDQAISNVYLEMIHHACINSKNAPKQSSASTAYRSSSGISIKHAFRADPRTTTYTDVLRKFKEFLMIHIQLALTKGFDDDSRRVAEYKHFFVNPTFGQWISAFQLLNKHLITLEVKNTSITNGICELDKYINVDSQYLENQCVNAFPKIYALYQRGLPEFYSEQLHRIKLTHAMNAYLNISRGTGVLPWLSKLAEKCDKYWKRGRQQCEAMSLFKHSCVNPMHRVAPENSLEIHSIPDMDSKLPEMKHNTGNRLISYCNCGRRQGTRDEPFTIREANYAFYHRLSMECCERFEQFNFPLFVAANTSELSLEDMLKILKLKSDIDSSVTTDDGDMNESESNVDSTSNNSSSQALETELRQENTLGDDESDQSQNENDNEAAATDIVQEDDIKLKKDVDNQLDLIRTESITSDIEYLPGMLHSKAPQGLLPLFSSWSLVCLGSSSIYNHSSGVGTRQGFLSGTNFLLPWDVMVKAEAGVSKPVPRFIRGRRQSSGKPKPISDEFNVKVFFGLEYECHRGHRFFANDFEKIVSFHSGNATSYLKEAAAKISNSDMPLYFKCPCKESRDGRTMIAQLMRIHIVTPKAPVHCTLSPKVHPALSPCPIFFPGNQEPIKLTPSSYWVLRLPFCYVGDEIFVQPLDTDISRSNGRLLKGTFNVVSMTPMETKIWERNAL